MLVGLLGVAIAFATLEPLEPDYSNGLVSGFEMRAAPVHRASDDWASPVAKHVVGVRLAQLEYANNDWRVVISRVRLPEASPLGILRTTGAPPLTFTEEFVEQSLPVGTEFTVGICRLANEEMEVSAGDIGFDVFWTRYDLTEPVQDPETGWLAVNLTVDKLAATADASIDTRKTFGDPNGVPNPNEVSRNLNFGSYIFRGGLFVGSYEEDNDRSGSARVQLWFGPMTDPANNHFRFALLSLYCPAQGVGGTATFDIGVLSPRTTPDPDPNLDVAEGELTWANAWDIPYNGTAKYWQTPLAEAAMPEVDQSEYANWVIGNVDDPPLEKRVLLQRLCLRHEYEGQWMNLWRYFISKEFQAPASAGTAYNDMYPRLWIFHEGQQ